MVLIHNGRNGHEVRRQGQPETPTGIPGSGVWRTRFWSLEDERCAVEYYIILLQAARTDSIYLCSDSSGTVRTSQVLETSQYCT